MSPIWAVCSHRLRFNGDISQWDVSKVTDMGNMFYNANAFNQDLSSWCVSNITSKPYYFDTDATAWTLPKPVWGTCPSRIEGPEEPGTEEHLILHSQGAIDLCSCWINHLFDRWR